ncbi:MAG: hypothetical protein HYZ22_05375 [Chloroflexi bacterium]|nr:hypothetical protein [Chloroflexota bacterium]
MNKSLIIRGKLVAGYRVASQPSKEYPYGTIERQKPFFKKLGLNLDEMQNGTLNISISPNIFEIVNPEYKFEDVEWTDLHPPETFSFSKCTIKFKGKNYNGWVYYPHPETKKRHFQDQSKIEVLAEPIPDIKYDDEVEIILNADSVSIK